MKNNEEKVRIRLNPVPEGECTNIPKSFINLDTKLSDKAFCLGMYLYSRLQSESNTLPDDMTLTAISCMKNIKDTTSARMELIAAGVLQVLPDNTFLMLDQDKLIMEDAEHTDGAEFGNNFTPAAFLDFPISIIERMPEMTPEAVCVALYLRFFEDYEESFFLPTDAQIGTATGLSTSSAKRARKELIDKDILFVDQEGAFDIDCGLPDVEYDEEDDDGEEVPIDDDDISVDLSLSSKEIEDSLKHLQDLGLVKKRPNGTLGV